MQLDVERRFDANVILWGSEGKPEDCVSNEAGAYVDLHEVGGRVERVDQNHVKYFLDLNPGEKRLVRYSVTYKRRKVGPELNTEKKREPLRAAPHAEVVIETVAVGNRPEIQNLRRLWIKKCRLQISHLET